MLAGIGVDMIGLSFTPILLSGALTNPGMTSDGVVDHMAYIMHWLEDPQTSPLTGLDLEHQQIYEYNEISLDDIFTSLTPPRGLRRRH